MNNYQVNAYQLTCLTNMHVGGGESEYGIVDKRVQRDPVSERPVIFSSSLKGAIREHFSHLLSSENALITYIFGPDGQRSVGKGKPGIGHFKFFQADLCVYPVRSDQRVFRRATSQNTLQEVADKAKMLGNGCDWGRNFGGLLTASEPEQGKPLCDRDRERLEDFLSKGGLSLTNNHLLGEHPAYFHDCDYKQLLKKLPTIARNQLENGVSKNLWYEEIVPRQSQFVFFVAMPKEVPDDVELQSFLDVFDSEDGFVMQVGGNASIGYGYCSIKKVK